MGKKILAALDNSEYALKVMKKALELAEQTKAELIGMSVIDNSYLDFCDECSAYALETQAYWKTSFEGILEKCNKLAEAADTDYKHVMINGIPAEEILQYADKENADMIIIGNLGRTAREGSTLGSVAWKVITFSKCPVLVVK